MKKEKLAAQLYTVRDHCKTLPDFKDTLQKIKTIGFTAVQVSGIGSFEPDETAEILREVGVTCCATHESGDMILNNPHQVVEKLQTLNCTATAYPFPGGIDLTNETDITTLIDGLNKSGEILAQKGLSLTYHNHAIEFARIEGTSILERIYTQTSPEFLQGEIDTYWVQYGGENPLYWCRRLSNRLPLLHLKDYGICITEEGSSPNFVEIGSGSLDWKSIIYAAEESGCQWFIIEQDRNWKDNNPFTSLEISYKYCIDNLCE